MLIYLKPLSLFPELHSDTLFGAITYAISLLYPENVVNDMISKFKEEPPFILSSTFPFAWMDEKDKDFKDMEKIKFFPKIIFSNSNSNKVHNPKIIKKYKKVDYVEDEIFMDLCAGKLTEDDILDNFGKDYAKVKGLLVKQDHKLDINYGKNTIPNNSVNRINHETEIFYSEGYEFDNMGLFFFVDFKDESYKNIVKSAIKFLKDRGFGPSISTGKGQFDYYIDEDYSLEHEFDLEGSDSNYFITLSRYIPSRNDLKFITEDSSYEIGFKRGKSPMNQKSKQIRFFKEGSIFPQFSEYYGSLVKTRKNPPAFEYGFAYPLKCIGKKGDIHGN